MQSNSQQTNISSSLIRNNNLVGMAASLSFLETKGQFIERELNI
jgi:hypothetical protein